MKYFAEIEIEKFHNDLENGNIDALLLLGQIKQVSIQLEELRQFAMPYAIDEFELQSDKTYSLGGFDFSKSAGGRYSYNNSQEWLSIVENKKKLELKMQDNYRNNMPEIIDAKTGEIFYAAEYKHNKESISISIKPQ